VFRIPQTIGRTEAEGSGEVFGIRAMTNLVGRVGPEPTTGGL